MNSWWYAWDAEVSDIDCEQIKSLFHAEATQIGKVGDDTLNKNIRSSTVVGFPYGSKINNQINDYVEKYIVMANSECFGFDLNGFREFQIAEYREGGHYDEHFDMRMDNRASVRKLGITVQLSDSTDYSGGEFMFTEDIGTPNQDIIKQKGTVIVFPSFLYHKVNPVSKGKRYSLVGWYEGNNWK
jgi:PKHD-type hydroxylase